MIRAWMILCFQFTLILMSWSQKQGPPFYSRCFLKRVWGETLWIHLVNLHEMIPLHHLWYHTNSSCLIIHQTEFLSSRRCHVVLKDRFMEWKWQFIGPKTCSAVCRFHLKCVQEQLVLIGSSDVSIKMFWWVTKWQHCCCLGNFELRSPFEIVHFELGKRHQLLRKDKKG